ncbi:MAG: 1,4-alpha-glucan branching enzyme, partial [Acidobacteriota bacterium]|nr:1,4-alpha-glucan branching enzyme [Acidobacteriota bacterium]
MESITQSSVPARELERLFALVHHDPHSILGAHPTARGIVVRAWQPGAARVELLVEGEAGRQMLLTHSRGLFELLVEDRTGMFPYRLRVHMPDGNVSTRHDPYAFLPT